MRRCVCSRSPWRMSEAVRKRAASSPHFEMRPFRSDRERIGTCAASSQGGRRRRATFETVPGATTRVLKVSAVSRIPTPGTVEETAGKPSSDATSPAIRRSRYRHLVAGRRSEGEGALLQCQPSRDDPAANLSARRSKVLGQAGLRASSQTAREGTSNQVVAMSPPLAAPRSGAS